MKNGERQEERREDKWQESHRWEDDIVEIAVKGEDEQTSMRALVP